MKAFAIGAEVRVVGTHRRGTVVATFHDEFGWHYVVELVGIPRGQYGVFGPDQIEEAPGALDYPRVALSGDWRALA